MKNIFFRTTSLWASVLYMALGLVLTFWPGMSGTVFCWGIAAALILYAAHSFWYFIKARNLGFTASGTLVIGILCLAFGIFCFSRPYVVLSFLPIALGIMLLVDGIGKMPLAVDALSVYSPYRFWVLISAVLPLILGIVLLVNPFRAAKAAIMFFGISILADGLFELITYNISFDHIRFLFYCFSHIRNKDVISVLEGKCFMIFFCQEWEHSPVDQV